MNGCLLLLLPALSLALPLRDTLYPNHLTQHFQEWLTKNGYETYDFVRNDIRGGSFGGRSSDNDTIENNPIIFIHGKSDKAYSFKNSFDYFLSRGYKESELYATTWGDPDLSKFCFYSVYHKKEYVVKIREFIKSVILYTGKNVNLITHSMGVTLTRKALKGGQGFDKTSYDLGEPLSAHVETFIGLGGLNHGTFACSIFPMFLLPLCDNGNGYYPGFMSNGILKLRSAFLADLDKNPGYEGSHRFAVYSYSDMYEMFGGFIYGISTGRIAASTRDVVYTDLTHNDLKDETVIDQFYMIKYHNITGLINGTVAEMTNEL